MKNSTIVMVAGVSLTMLLIGVVVGSLAFPVTKTTTQEIVSTETGTITETFNRTVLLNSTVTSPITTGCSTLTSPPAPIGLYFGAVFAASSSPAYLCVQFYYYSANVLALNLSSSISIDASGTTLFSGASNFSVTTVPNMLSLGGPNQENEGYAVLLAITSHTGASGTYGISLHSLALSGIVTYMLTPSEPVECGEYGELVAANGQPYYVPEGGCISYSVSYDSQSTSGNSSGYYSVPGVPYPLLPDDLYFRVIGALNSTS